MEFVRSRKMREALGNLTSASLYCFNVNRTSQDHLLLGESADVDKSVECPEYSAGLQRDRNDSEVIRSETWAEEGWHAPG